VTQRALSDAFSDLAQKNPELGEEFSYNSETQRVLCKNGDTLLGKKLIVFLGKDREIARIV